MKTRARASRKANGRIEFESGAGDHARSALRRLATPQSCAVLFRDPMWPAEWSAQAERIIATNASMTDRRCPWWAGWSPIFATVKPGPFSGYRSHAYQLHDAIHQLWPLANPGRGLAEWIRVALAGEVAVLVVTELTMHPMALERGAGPTGHIRNRLGAAVRDEIGDDVARAWDAVRGTGALRSSVGRRWSAYYRRMLDGDEETCRANFTVALEVADLAPDPEYPACDERELVERLVGDFFCPSLGFEVSREAYDRALPKIGAWKW